MLKAPCLAGLVLRKRVHPAASAERDPLDSDKSLRQAPQWSLWPRLGAPLPGLARRLLPAQPVDASALTDAVHSEPGEFKLVHCVPPAACVGFLALLGAVRLWFDTKAFFTGENAGAAAARRPVCTFQVAAIIPSSFRSHFFNISPTNWTVQGNRTFPTRLEHSLCHLSIKVGRFLHSRGRVQVNMVALRILLLPHAGNRRSSCR